MRNNSGETNMINVNRSLLCLGIILLSQPVTADTVQRAEAVTQAIPGKPYLPPMEETIPENKFGDMVRLGKKIFTETGKYAGKYVGNGMKCVNCHLDAGRLANSAPLWAAWVKYPAYRGKNEMVNTMEERLQGCFTYSMNGNPPPADSQELKALMSYAYWMAEGAPTGVDLPGRGYPKLAKPQKTPDFQRGKQVFVDNCALCHGEKGEGVARNGNYVFPPLWGKDSFNWGAGMHRINTAAAFIRANMPLGKGGSLTVQQAWDVAYYINSHERPQDPRFKGDVKVTKNAYHQHQCRYGEKIDKHVLGKSLKQ
jgi:thiosulfate dehydrogenase